MRSLTDLRNAKVLVRADLNVPLKDGQVRDMSRIMASLPTIQQLLQQGCGVVVCSHLGRPKTKSDTRYSLKPVADQLAKVLARPVNFINDCLQQKKIHLGEVALLENTRFYAQEKANDADFAKSLAAGCDAFVFDAFGVAHRTHASIVGITQYLPSSPGLLLQKELDVLGCVIANPERPLAVLVGGAKLETKINVLKSLATKADQILLGGGIANTFLAHTTGVSVGSSLWEPAASEIVAEITRIAREHNCHITLPVDAVVSQNIRESAATEIRNIDDIQSTEKILDLGPQSVDMYQKVIANAQMFVWNGPVGIFELSPFAAGTKAIVETAANLIQHRKKAILGGGDTLAAAGKFGYSKNDFHHLSTGGGAMLELLEGKELPAVKNLY